MSHMPTTDQPDGNPGVANTREVNTTGLLTGGGNLTEDRTISVVDIATASVIGRTTSGTGQPEVLTATQTTALLDTVTSGLKGLAPASGGGSTNFLRADGTWAAPAGGGVPDDIDIGGSGTVPDPLVLKPDSIGFLTAKAYGATADGSTDDRAALAAGLAAAASEGAVLQLGEGTYKLGRDGSSAWCLSLEGVTDVTIQGVKGKTKLKAASGLPDATIALLRLNGCKRITIRDVDFDGGWGNAATVVTWASNNVALPAATINVADTSRFASTGTFYVVVGADDIQAITYTGKTATSFTGCSGGTGTLKTDAGVGFLDDKTGINHTTQADPRNHLLMLRGCEDVTVENCTFSDAYGDMVWLGYRGDPSEDGLQVCRNIKLIGCVGNVSARNGLSIGQAVDGLTVENCEWRNCFVSAFDVEAQGNNQFVRDVKIVGGFYGLWWHPSSGTRYLSQAVAITGAGVYGIQDGDSARSVSIVRASIQGSLGIWAARWVTVTDCTFITAWDHGSTNGSYAPVYIDHVSDGIDIIGNNFYDRGRYSASPGDPEDDQHYAVINVQNYADSLRPAGIRIAGNKIKARNGRAGIKVAGGAGGQVDGTQNFTAAAITSTTVTVTAAGWTDNEHAGKMVYRAGLCAAVSGNVSDTLAVTGWFLPFGEGSFESTPSAGAIRLIANSGVVVVEGNEIDCLDDENGAGGYGIAVIANLSGNAVRVKDNIIRCATGYGVYAALGALSTYFELVGNHVYDDQQVKTTTSAYHLLGVGEAAQTVIHGNTHGPGIDNMTGITTGTWQTSNSYPGSWAGYDDPNGSIYAPASSTYHRINSNAIYVKQSPESSAQGWQPVVTAPRATLRGIGTPDYGPGVLTPGLPPSVEGDIEVMICMTFDASVTAFSDAAGFVMEIDGVSSYLGGDNRSSIWWRRFRPGDGAPTTTSHTFDYNAVIIMSFKDCIGYGNPFADATFAGNDGVGLLLSAPTATSTVANSLVVNALTWFAGGGGGTPGNADSWTNGDLTEVEEVTDNRLSASGDIISIAAATGRDVAAGAFGATTVQLYDSYANACMFTLVLIPAVVSARSEGTITCTTKANYVDTDYMTIGDGMGIAKVYEFDAAGNGVTGGRVQVDISTDTTAAQVAARLRTAILANQPALGVVDNADGTLTVTHQWPGAGGNVAMAEFVANAGHTVVGLAGGQG
jgi:hypothetical protein